MSLVRDFRLGRYVEADSFLHGIDSRTKILAGTLLLGWVFLFPGWASFGLLAAVLLASIRASSLPLSWVLGNLRALTALWVVCFLANLVLSGGGEPLWRDPSWVGIARGSEQGLFLCLRLGLVVGIGSIVSLTTCPTDLADSVEWGLRKLPGSGRGASRAALILVLAWTFVPVLVEEARRLRQAQRARGGCPRGGWLGEALAWRSTWVPLMIGALHSSEGLALAMEARGFGGTGRRSFYREFRLRRSDLAVTLLCVGALVGGGFLWAWEETL